MLCRSEARSQGLLGIPHGCRIPKLWAILYHFPRPQAGRWMGNGAAGTQTNGHLGSWSVQSYYQAQLFKFLSVALHTFSTVYQCVVDPCSHIQIHVYFRRPSSLPPPRGKHDPIIHRLGLSWPVLDLVHMERGSEYWLVSGSFDSLSPWCVSSVGPSVTGAHMVLCVGNMPWLICASFC